MNHSTTVTSCCHLSFHGAAANSSPHSLLWIRAPNSATSTTAKTTSTTTTATPTATTPTTITDSTSTTTTAPQQSSSTRPLQTNQHDDDDYLVDTIIYASSGVINLATSHSFQSNTITTVESTLVTRTLEAGTAISDSNTTTSSSSSGATKRVLARGEAVEDAAAPRSITTLTWVSNNKNDGHDDDNFWQSNYFGIVAAFSDGTVTSWRYNPQNSLIPHSGNRWEEHVIVGYDPTTSCASTIREGSGGGDEQPHSQTEGVKVEDDRSNIRESIADISAATIDYCRAEKGYDSTTLMVATASSRGIFLHVSHVSTSVSSSTSSVDSKNVTAEKKERVFSRHVSHHATTLVHLQCRTNSTDETTSTKECYLFAGSAAPRHNKVWVYTVPYYHSHDCSTNNNKNSNNNNAATDYNSETSSSSKWVALPLLSIGIPQYHGHLMGHQDWITCSAWLELLYVADDQNNEKKRKTKASLLATSGHDAKIRLWKFATSTIGSSSQEVQMPPEEEMKDDRDNARQDVGINIEDDDDDENEDEAIIDDLQEDEGEARLIIAHDGNESTAVSLEALLMGHEEAVTSLSWRPRQRQNGGIDKPCLLSSSMDRTILLWMEEIGDEEGGGGIWTPISRVGSAGGILGGSIGASLMGFVDAAFSPDASRIVGHGYGGSIHFWTKTVQSKIMAIEKEHGDENEVDDDADDKDNDDELIVARWVADPCITGHFRSVEDMAWDPNGEYLLTTSSDQTTRIWMEVPISSTSCRWIEVGRPQVHGYDMSSIACIGGRCDNDDENDGGEPRHRFVSGADEKVLRVFDAPVSTLRLLRSIRQSRSTIQVEQVAENYQSSSSTWRVERAFMPSLGLSNKASADTDQESSKYSGPVNDDAFAQTLDTVEGDCIGLKLPSERDLGVTTLWPEARKLFGHETELVCLDAYRAPSGSNGVTLVASSCKARNDVATAAIRLWDANKGTCVGILKGGHRSTVSTMSFSRDGKYLASSGKDRRICIWKKTSLGSSENGLAFELLAAADSAHKRIVYTIHFCPERPDILASGSRDGMIKLWYIVDTDDGALELKEIVRFEPSFKGKGEKEPVTAVAFAERLLQVDDVNSYGILSIGTGSGRIEVWAVPVTSEESSQVLSPILLHTVPPNDSHFDSVKKIAWRPATTTSAPSARKNDVLTFASCGQDNGVRIYDFKVDIGMAKE